MGGLFDDLLVPHSKLRLPRRGAQLSRPVFQKPAGWTPHDDLPELSGIVALDFENKDPGLSAGYGTSWPHGLGFTCGAAISWSGGDFYLSWGHSDGNIDKARAVRWLKVQAAKPEVTFLFANCVYDLGWLWREGIVPLNLPHDVQGMAALLDEFKFSYSLDNLGREYLGDGKSDEAFIAACAAGGLHDPKSHMDLVPGWIAEAYGVQDASLTRRLYDHFLPLLEAENLIPIYTLERECYLVGFDMKRNGVRVDTDEAVRQITRFEGLRDAKLELVRQTTGVACSATDNQALARALRVENPSLDLPQTTQGRDSIRKEIMESLKSPVAGAINAARRYDKASNTFLTGYILESSVKGRIHADFNPLRRSGTDNDSNEGMKGATGGRWSCVASWTLIETSFGIKPIRNVEPGDMVWTHANRWRRVTHKHIKPKQQMFDVFLSNGQVLTCTKKHRILSNDGEWNYVGDLYEHFKKMGISTKESRFRNCLVPKQRMFDTRPNSREVRNDLRDNNSYSSKIHVRQREKSSQVFALSLLENGKEKSHDRQIFRETPQLERSLLGQQGLFDNQAREEKDFSSYCDVFRFTWSGQTSSWFRGSSYRRQRNQQCIGQSCFSNEERTCDNTWHAEKNAASVQIERIEVTGSFEVHDITVEEDSSYLACGIFSHNCTGPNLQNLPTRDKEIGPAVRGCFLPEEGEDWGKLDFSSQEPRLAVHFAEKAKLKGAREMADRFRSNPKTDLHQEVADNMNVQRGPAKTISLAIWYGAGGAEVCRRLGLPTAHKRLGNGDVIEIAGDEGTRLLRNHHRAFPFIKELQKATKEAADRRGWIRTLEGRIVRFQKRGDEYSRTHKACNAVCQGSAGDQTKRAQVAMRRAGITPLIVVHDDTNNSIPKGDSGARLVAQIKEIMETAVTLTIPVVADVKIGENWAAVSG